MSGVIIVGIYNVLIYLTTGDRVFFRPPGHFSLFQWKIHGFSRKFPVAGDGMWLGGGGGAEALFAMWLQYWREVECFLVPSFSFSFFRS